MSTEAQAALSGAPPKVYNLYLFNREGVCLQYREWHRTNRSQSTAEEDCKIVFGIFWAMQQVAVKLDPTNPDRPGTQEPFPIGEHNTFRSFSANNYKLHFMNTPTGVKLVLNTAPTVDNLKELLQQIYTECYVDRIIKNPCYTPGEPFECDLFNQHLHDVLYRKGLL